MYYIITCLGFLVAMNMHWFMIIILLLCPLWPTINNFQFFFFFFFAVVLINPQIKVSLPEFKWQHENKSVRGQSSFYGRLLYLLKLTTCITYFLFGLYLEYLNIHSMSLWSIFIHIQNSCLIELITLPCKHC